MYACTYVYVTCISVCMCAQSYLRNPEDSSISPHRCVQTLLRADLFLTRKSVPVTVPNQKSTLKHVTTHAAMSMQFD